MWVIKPKPNSQARLKLFCLPFAGGSSVSFYNWAELLPETLELCLIEIPGRGQRLSEPLRHRLDELVPEIAEGIKDELEQPFVLFGHSMGALLGYELTYLLQTDFQIMPQHLFLSGRGAPHLPNRDEPIHQLPEADFVRHIKKFNGTPKAVLEHQELMELLLPILRADFEICETYQYRSKEKITCPLTILGGLQDSGATREELAAWRKLSSGPFNLRLFPGDHFYLLEQRPKLIETIMRDIDYHFSLTAFKASR